MSNKTSDKNVANIEDDVNELKSIMNLRTESGFAYSQKNTLKLQKSIRNVLAEREQDKKRIQELEEQVKTLDEAYTGTIKESKKWFDIAHNSIPKQVVIDEVKRLKNILKATTEGILQKYTVEEIIIKINTFEELLEDMENGRK